MKSLKRVLVIDVEATCWKSQKDTPDNESSEIIQIGAVLVDAEQLVRIDKRRIYVKPERSRISDFCSRLTGITEKDVANGVSFESACEQLRTDFKSKEIPWASYGDYDRHQFIKQTNGAIPFGSRHINVKTLAGLALGEQHELGMDEALSKLNLELEGRHHDAADDAWNIAKIFIHLMKKCRSN